MKSKKQQIRRARPADAAQAFVRVLLADAGALAGGVSEEEWEETLKYFDHKCAYSGEPLENEISRDHAIPINRTHCGLHLYGNVVPTTKKTNQDKGSKDFREWLAEGDPRRKRIEYLLEKTRYWQKSGVFGDLQAIANMHYRNITRLSLGAKEYLESFIDETIHEVDSIEKHEEKVDFVDNGENKNSSKKNLKLDFRPREANGEFRDQLIKRKEAWIKIIYDNGQEKIKRWDARNMQPSSNVIGNLRSRPEFRAGMWERMGIERVEVTIEKPIRQN